MQWWYFTHDCINHNPRRTSIDFGFKRSKVTVIFWLWTFYRFRTITPSPFGIQWLYFTHVLIMTRGGPLYILGSKGQRQRSYLDICFYCFRTITPFAYGIQSWYFTHVLIFWLWTFYRFRMKIPFPFGIYMYWPWPEEDLYWFWVKRPKVKVVFGLTTFSWTKEDPIDFGFKRLKKANLIHILLKFTLVSGGFRVFSTYLVYYQMGSNLNRDSEICLRSSFYPNALQKQLCLPGDAQNRDKCYISSILHVAWHTI